TFNTARNDLRSLLNPKRITEVQKSLAELRSLDPSALDFESRFLTVKRFLETETSGVAESAAPARNQIEHALKQYAGFTSGSGDRVMGYSPIPEPVAQRKKTVI